MHPVESWNKDECQPINEIWNDFGPKEGDTIWNVQTLQNTSHGLSEIRFHMTLMEIMDAGSNPKNELPYILRRYNPSILNGFQCQNYHPTCKAKRLLALALLVANRQRPPTYQKARFWLKPTLRQIHSTGIDHFVRSIFLFLFLFYFYFFF